jgi:aryl-alcohol dehydrogenase (NADP+)
MQYSNLGKSGLKVSRICLGMMSFGSSQWRPYTLDEAESRPIIQRAIELGINFFDTADMYSTGISEEITGRAIRDFMPRQEAVVATKVYFPIGQGPNGGGLSRKHIMEGIDNSLRRLGMDYVDLYQIHRWDYTVPIEETMGALHDVVKAGKALYIGASSMFAWQFAQAQHTAEIHGWTKFVSMQNHMNAVYREEEREMLPLCLDQGVGVIPWSPLARGFLAGNRTREGWGETTRAKSDSMAQDYYYGDNDFEVVDRVKAVAQEQGVKPAQVALAWLLHKPGVTAPIVGMSKMSQLEDAAAAVDIKLTPEQIALIEEPYLPHQILGHA